MSAFTIKKPELPWGGYDFSKKSLAMVALGAEDGCAAVLFTVGAHVRMEMEEAGLVSPEELGLEPPKPPGIWVWEGRGVWSPGGFEHPEDGDMCLEGKWRKPTDGEWASLRAGMCPWDDAEWMLHECQELCHTNTEVEQKIDPFDTPPPLRMCHACGKLK